MPTDPYKKYFWQTMAVIVIVFPPLLIGGMWPDVVDNIYQAFPSLFGFFFLLLYYGTSILFVILFIYGLFIWRKKTGKHSYLYWALLLNALLAIFFWQIFLISPDDTSNATGPVSLICVPDTRIPPNYICPK